MTLTFKLALRFMRSNRRGALTRFISFASTCGIALGVFAAVVGLSAMNGFEYELRNRVLSLVPSATLRSEGASFKDADAIERTLLRSRGISGVSQGVQLRAVLIADRTFLPVMLRGISPDSEGEVTNLERFSGVSFDALKPSFHHVTNHASPKSASAMPEEVRETLRSANMFESAQSASSEMCSNPHIIIGASLARKLGVGVGDSIELVTLHPAAGSDADASLQEQSLSGLLQSTSRSRAEIVGLFNISGQMDSLLAVLNSADLMRIAGMEGPNSIFVRTENYDGVRNTMLEAMSGKINESLYLSTWDAQFGKVYHDIQMVRHIVYIAMFLVLAVACFNIISNLMMLTGEKRREVAVLLSLGMRRRDIVRSFAMTGVLTGGYGIVIGLVTGVPFSVFITPLTASFKDLFGFELLNGDMYFINFVPSILEVSDALVIAGAALLMSLLSALYPALRASAVDPARELSKY